MQLYEGTVVRAHGGHYYVESDHGTVDCLIRGRLKKEETLSDLVTVGDRARWSPIGDGTGIIEEVLPRKSVLSRSVPPPRAGVNSDTEQVIVANVDQVVTVFSVRNPPPNPLMLDRYLVACEAVDLPVAIVANKIDLIPHGEDRDVLALYRRIGYLVLYTSAVTGQGIETLRDLLRGRLSVLAGPSGTGKSSLLNTLWPELDLQTGEISEYHDRGKHTTVVARLLNPKPGTYVADTPGLRQFRFWDIDPEQLEAFFPEMLPYLGKCRFTPCTHMHEPACAVRDAVERGEIAPLRYESYYKMFQYGF